MPGLLGWRLAGRSGTGNRGDGPLRQDDEGDRSKALLWLRGLSERASVGGAAATTKAFSFGDDDRWRRKGAGGEGRADCVPTLSPGPLSRVVRRWGDDAVTTPLLPFAEVECPCLTCRRMVMRPKKRRGRHSRFCSFECKRVANVERQRARRGDHPDFREEGRGRVESLDRTASRPASSLLCVAPSFRINFFLEAVRDEQAGEDEGTGDGWKSDQDA